MPAPADSAAVATNMETAADEVSAGPILPLAGATNLPTAKVALGRQLFHSTALSGAMRKVSCATCHPLDQGGTRGMVQENTGDGGSDQYDVPTVFNSAQHFAFFWSGRAQSLEAAVQSSIRSKNVMDASWSEVLSNLEASGDFTAAFNAVYPEDGISEASVEDALVTFLESLATPNAAFDRWLNGESLPPRALEGYTLFKEIGCARCHQGVAAGGNMYASFQGYIEQKATIRTPDFGRYNVTNNEAHKYQFKVPSLRNVAVTAPYFHDGGAENLKDAVDAMAIHQLGRDLTSGEIDLIVTFLESLTGWYDERILSANREGASP